MYLLDTNICIYVMMNSFPQLTSKIFSHNPAEMIISSISVYELEYGAAKSHWGEKPRQKMSLFLAPFNILDFDSSAAYYSGQIRAWLEQRGLIIGPYDIQLAGQALSRGLTVITHNTSEFSRIPNLKFEDWVI